MRSLAASAVVWTIVALASPALAEGPEGGTPPAGAGQCVPACRVGFMCVSGQCVSACNPPCAGGQTCTAQGQCATPSAGLCSPPCHAGETCSNGICILEQSAAPVAPPVYPPQSGIGPGYLPPPALAPPPPPDPGWALAGGVIGLSSAAAVGLLTAVAGGIAAADAAEEPFYPVYQDGGTVNVLAAVATVLVTAMVPVTAAGSGSARDGQVRGVGALRVFGWIFYGGAVANALALLSTANIQQDADHVNGHHYPKWTIATGALAVASLAFHAIDAFVAYADASSRQASQRRPADAPAGSPAPTGLRLVPTAGVVPTGDGGATGFLGLGGAF